jgi:hypothetical protein
LKLLKAGLVLHGAVHPIAVGLGLGGGPQGPVGIEQVRARQAAQVGAAGGDDRVDMVEIKLSYQNTIFNIARTMRIYRLVCSGV